MPACQGDHADPGRYYEVGGRRVARRPVRRYVRLALRGVCVARITRRAPSSWGVQTARLPGDALAMGLLDLRPGALWPVRSAHVMHYPRWHVQADKYSGVERFQGWRRYVKGHAEAHYQASGHPLVMDAAAALIHWCAAWHNRTITSHLTSHSDNVWDGPRCSYDCDNFVTDDYVTDALRDMRNALSSILAYGAAGIVALVSESRG